MKVQFKKPYRCEFCQIGLGCTFEFESEIYVRVPYVPSSVVGMFNAIRLTDGTQDDPNRLCYYFREQTPVLNKEFKLVEI